MADTSGALATVVGTGGTFGGTAVSSVGPPGEGHENTKEVSHDNTKTAPRKHESAKFHLGRVSCFRGQLSSSRLVVSGRPAHRSALTLSWTFGPTPRKHERSEPRRHENSATKTRKREIPLRGISCFRGQPYFFEVSWFRGGIPTSRRSVGPSGQGHESTKEVSHDDTKNSATKTRKREIP
jgi:hypothetical protein